jgi:hypothetical protein
MSADRCYAAPRTLILRRFSNDAATPVPSWWQSCSPYEFLRRLRFTEEAIALCALSPPQFVLTKGHSSLDPCRERRHDGGSDCHAEVARSFLSTVLLTGRGRSTRFRVPAQKTVRTPCDRRVRVLAREESSLPANAQISAANHIRLAHPRGRRRNLFPATKSLHALKRVLVTINVARQVIFVAHKTVEIGLLRQQANIAFRQ